MTQTKKTQKIIQRADGHSQRYNVGSDRVVPAEGSQMPSAHATGAAVEGSFVFQESLTRTKPLGSYWIENYGNPLPPHLSPGWDGTHDVPSFLDSPEQLAAYLKQREAVAEKTRKAGDPNTDLAEQLILMRSPDEDVRVALAGVATNPEIQLHLSREKNYSFKVFMALCHTAHPKVQKRLARDMWQVAAKMAALSDDRELLNKLSKDGHPNTEQSAKWALAGRKPGGGVLCVRDKNLAVEQNPDTLNVECQSCVDNAAAK